MSKFMKCRLCGKNIAGMRQDFQKRMSLLRNHYKENHPKEFKKSVKKGVEARKKRK